MIIFALLPGVAIPALVGWLALDLLERDARVLWKYEKWALGFALGTTISMYCVFLANVFLGVPLTLVGFLGVYAALLLPLGAARLCLRRLDARTGMPCNGAVADVREPPPDESKSSSEMRSSRRAAAIFLAIIGAWVGFRMLAMWLDVLATPTFFDDAMDNWNLRGKLFYFQQTISLSFPWDQNPGVSSYPPAVPLVKAWLSVLAGTWHEGLINGIHGLWFACLIAIVYCALRRTLSAAWAALGAILLASLPLELVHGMNPYADVFLSLHLLIAVVFLFHALSARAQERSLSWLRLAALAIALVPFTKNEGWALYFPIIVVLFAGCALWTLYRGTITGRQAAWTALLALILAALIATPWILYKAMNGLAFGNAKGIDWSWISCLRTVHPVTCFQGYWQRGVTLSIVVNTFFEGNWGLLFPLFFGLLVARFRAVFRTPLLLLAAFVLIPYFIQLFLYMFTGLSTEAILQTGYARGLIHLMPVIVIVTVILLHDALRRN